jgi:4-hydroxybenzoate polyprenyltransferase
MNFINKLRFNHLLKNFIIFFPVIVSNNYYVATHNLRVTFISFFILSFLVLKCYLINDFCDQKTDKLNKLKNIKIISYKDLINGLLFLTIINIIIIIYFDFYKIFFLFLYLVNFLIYNFIIKKIKYLDIIFLTNFYLIRILFGADVFNLNLSYGFIIFFYLFFISLSLSKRYVQIQSNHLKPNNIIIKYSTDDLNKILIANFFFYCLSTLIFFFYLFNVFYKINFLEIFFKESIKIQNIVVLFISYLFWVIRVILFQKNRLINKDFYIFFLKDKMSYFLLIINIILFFY